MLPMMQLVLLTAIRARNRLLGLPSAMVMVIWR